MHLRFARRTSAIRYYSLSRQISRGVLNFCNTAETSRFTAAGNFPSLQIAPSKMSAATLTVHVIIYCLRPTAKTLLIVTFVFVACPFAARSNRYIAILWYLPRLRGSYLPDACDMQGRYTPSSFFLPSKHVKQRKGNIDIVAYSDTLVRRIYRKMRGKMLLNRTICLKRDAKQVNFIRLHIRL